MAGSVVVCFLAVSYEENAGTWYFFAIVFIFAGQIMRDGVKIITQARMTWLT